ncbi:MAG: UDP-N-acetylmuramoyl-L-alanine--D-glutamate ligase [Microgenomates group bacterium]
MSNSLLEKLQYKFKNKKVLIVGLGLQGGGIGLAQFFSRLKANVVITDLKSEEKLRPSVEKLKGYPITFHLAGHKKEDFLTADYIFKGPSVPWDLPEIKAAQEKGIPIEMELSFFCSLAPAKIIGVTGTRGKSTTSYLIFKILKELGYSVYLAGNFPGISTIELLEKINRKDWVVLELSSWALSGFHQKKISPHIAILTNFYPDHLNYYRNINQYFYDKMAIFAYQKDSDYFIANENLKDILKSETKKFNINLPKKIYWFNSRQIGFDLDNLKGDHNKENVSAVLTLVKVLNLDQKEVEKMILNFKGLPYRQEIIGRKDNIIFVNDSTSTTPVATIKAIERFQDRKIILMLGGNSKNLPLNDLIEKLAVVEKIILLEGSFTESILPFLKEKYADKLIGPFDDLEKAVKVAYQLSKKTGGYLLFSPGATSFSMFNNEFHRGEIFNQIVKKIINTKNKI